MREKESQHDHVVHHRSFERLGAAPARAVLDHGDNAVIIAGNVSHLRDLVDAHPTRAPAAPLDVTNTAAGAAARVRPRDTAVTQADPDTGKALRPG